MTDCNPQNFINVHKIGDSNLLDQLEENMKAYLDNGFLHIGGWIDSKRIQTLQSEPRILTESYIDYSTSFSSLYAETFSALSDSFTEILEVVDLDISSRTSLLVNFDPNLGGIDDRRLRMIASGTQNAATLNMLDTGFLSSRQIFSLITPTGYDKLLIYIDPNSSLSGIDIKVSGFNLPTNLYETVSTTTSSQEYTLFFDAYGGGSLDDPKNLILTAHSGNSSVSLINTGYVLGTSLDSLDCIPTGVSTDTTSYSFTKPAGYDSITIDYSNHNIYSNSFYYKIQYLNNNTLNSPVSLYGDLPYQLKTTEVNGYKLGQVWQSSRKDWVWETGIQYRPDPVYCQNFSPINISGVYVNNNFLPGPTGVAATGYYINYPLGQIVFDKAIPKTSKVELDYSYRWCQVYKSSSDSSWKELQELTYTPNPSINQTNTGDYSISANHRIQLPCVIIEPASRTSSTPYQLGGFSHFHEQDILLHVFAENNVDQNRICDIIRLQKGYMMKLYDINKVVKSGKYSLNYNGSININGLQYSELIRDYFWKNSWIKDFAFNTMESMNKNLYWCIIRLTSETIT